MYLSHHLELELGVGCSINKNIYKSMCYQQEIGISLELHGNTT